MIQGTTPTLTFRIEGIDLRNKTVYLTAKQKDKKDTWKNDRLTITYENEVSTVALTLTQDETLAWEPGYIDLQIKWIDATQTVQSTKIARVLQKNAQLKKVISYDGA